MPGHAHEGRRLLRRRRVLWLSSHSRRQPRRVSKLRKGLGRPRLLLLLEGGWRALVLAGSSIVNKSSGSSFLPGSSSFTAGAGSAAGPGWGPGVSRRPSPWPGQLKRPQAAPARRLPLGPKSRRGPLERRRRPGREASPSRRRRGPPGGGGGAGEAWAWAAGVGAGVSSPKAAAASGGDHRGLERHRHSAAGVEESRGPPQVPRGRAERPPPPPHEALGLENLVDELVDRPLVPSGGRREVGGGHQRERSRRNARAKALPKENVTDWNRSLDLSLSLSLSLCVSLTLRLGR